MPWASVVTEQRRDVLGQFLTEDRDLAAAVANDVGDFVRARFIVLIGTTMASARRIACRAMMNCGLFCMNRATRSPRRTPQMLLQIAGQRIDLALEFGVVELCRRSSAIAARSG